MPRIISVAIVLSIVSSACRTGDPWGEDGDVDWPEDTGTAVDADRDGFSADEDCNDNNSNIYPGAEEQCDTLDNNCDGQIDEGVGLLLYVDADGDGFGDETIKPFASCDDLPGYELSGGDCDDTRADVYPDAPEQCDDVDNDCDTSVDENVQSIWYADRDGDGFGDAGAELEDCDPPSGYVANDRDCNDDDGTIHPDAEEVCDEVDNDCNGLADDNPIDADIFYVDIDGDGFGDPTSGESHCEAPSGMVTDNRDCNDGDATIHPDATEVCDEVDNDCDGQVDDDDGSVVGDVWYGDADGDGYGGDTFQMRACNQPSAYVDNAEDCDDLNPDINPGGQEICNELDDDCDGDVDDDDDDLDSATTLTWYADDDGDGFGDADATIQRCAQPSNATDDDTDCDDSDPDIHPDADEECDGIDNDCDGEVDTGFTDTDGDGEANCVDKTIFSDDFSDTDWGDWTDVGLTSSSTNWNMDGNTFYEVSDAADSIAYGPDLGELDTYVITVDVWSGGYYNNALGIAFAVQDSDNYLLMEWDDFNDFYGAYSPAGEAILWECISGSCSELGSDDDSSAIVMDYATWTTIELSVDGSEIQFTVDGTLVFEHTYTGGTPIGADRTGVYSRDNDNGIYFDDFEVTQP